MKYDYEVDPDAFTAAATILRWLPEGARVLDVGCAAGGLTRLMRDLKGCRVIGAELHPEAAAQAHDRGLDVRVGDVRDAAFRATLAAAGPFDRVVCADVLEHLSDPEVVLVAAQEWLGPQGRLLVSVPNVAYLPLVAELAAGRLHYRDAGLLDRTHLRFFTFSGLRDLLERSGFLVTRRERIRVPYGAVEFPPPPAWLREALERAAGDEGDVYQHVVEAAPAAEPELAAEQARRLAAAEAEADRLRFVVAERDRELAVTVADLRRLQAARWRVLKIILHGVRRLLARLSPGPREDRLGSAPVEPRADQAG